jgi:ABC-type molybdate transport system substrate-binding protein
MTKRIVVLSTISAKEALIELLPEFERTTGDKVDITYAGGRGRQRLAEEGARADVGRSNRAVVASDSTSAANQSASTPLAPSEAPPPSLYAGRMFWLWWKTLSGSYVVFTSISRS